MRTYEFNGSSKTIAATTAQTLIWSGSDLPGSGVVAFYLSLAAAGNTLADIDRIRVKARGSTIYDLTTAQLRSFLEATLPSHAIYVTTGQVLTIPFFDLLETMEQDQDAQQFPYGETPQVEIVTGAGTAAGTAIMGWCLTDQRPAFYPRLLSSAHNIAASATNGRMNYGEPDDLRGLSIPTTGLNRLKVYQNGTAILSTPGVGYAASSGDISTEITKVRSRYDGSSVTDPVWHIPRTGVPAAPGGSWIEADTGAGWTATGEVCIYGRSPQLV